MWQATLIIILRLLENTLKWDVGGSLSKPKCNDIAIAIRSVRAVACRDLILQNFARQQINQKGSSQAADFKKRGSDGGGGNGFEPSDKGFKKAS